MKSRVIRPWEIYACLGIVVFLALFLYPMFANAKTNHRSPCLSHLKMIGVAMLMYASDNDDRLPNRDLWMDATGPYTRSETTYHCPTVAGDRPKVYGYAFNTILSEATSPPKPDTVPLAFDSVNLERNASSDLDGLPKPGRHDGRNTMAFADGHAKSIPVLK